MERNKYKLFFGVLMMSLGIVSIFLMGTRPFVYPVWSPGLMFTGENPDHITDYTCTVKEEGGKVISKMARNVATGDEIIAADGSHYRVVRVQDDTAYVENRGMDKDFLAYRDFFAGMEVPVASMDKNDKKVGIYHTHSAESYVPTDGKDSVPFRGGIYKVGERLVSKLRENRVNVAHDKTPHDPHDNNAYHRSRRTAANLMGENTVALIDVHRDGIPDPDFYSRKIDNTDVAQLRLVVGRQNPHMSSNLDFAKRMMAYANKTHPGIVKEIFMARGNYNQDLMPTALLIEAGTHTNTREQAENGVALFADAIPTVLGIQTAPGSTGAAPPTAPTTGSPGAWNSLAWIVGVLLVGGGAFLVISSGGLDKAKSRLSGFLGREFTGFLSPRRARKRIEFLNGSRAGGPEGDNTSNADAKDAARENMEKARND